MANTAQTTLQQYLTFRLGEETFAVDTHDASEALTHLQELSQCQLVEAAR